MKKSIIAASVCAMMLASAPSSEASIWKTIKKGAKSVKDGIHYVQKKIADSDNQKRGHSIGH